MRTLLRIYIYKFCGGFKDYGLTSSDCRASMDCGVKSYFILSEWSWTERGASHLYFDHSSPAGGVVPYFDLLLIVHCWPCGAAKALRVWFVFSFCLFFNLNTNQSSSQLTPELILTKPDKNSRWSPTFPVEMDARVALRGRDTVRLLREIFLLF